MTISVLPSLHDAPPTSSSRGHGALVRRALLACGIASSLVYVAANVVASIAWPSYLLWIAALGVALVRSRRHE